MLNTVGTTVYKKDNTPSFKNGMVVNTLAKPAVTGFFRYLHASPVAEIVGLDFATMVAPRTISDTKQNPVYGVETFFKEMFPIIPNPFLPGIVAGALIAKRGYKGLYANSTTLDGLHKAWQTADPNKQFPVKNPNKPFSMSKRMEQFKFAQKYAEEALIKTEGFVGTEYKHLRDGNKLTKQGKRLAKRMAALMVGDNNDKVVEKRLKKITEKYTALTGAEDNLKVKLGEGYTTNARMHFRDVVTAGRKLFTEVAPKELEAEVKSLKKFSKTRTAQAITSAIIFGSSIQWLINKTSSLLTGKKGFTGYKDFTEGQVKVDIPKEEADKIRKENRAELIRGKIYATAGMLGIMATTMGAVGKKGIIHFNGAGEYVKKGIFNKDAFTNFVKKGIVDKKSIGKFLKNLEIKDRFAHMDVIRGVYGSILISRFWASREKPELKVDVAKNYLGYLNWLVLGPFVAKGIASAFDKGSKTFMNGEVNKKAKGMFGKVGSWLGDVSQKSPLEFKHAIKDMPKSQKLIKTAVYNGSKIGGLAWSALALGFGVPLVVNNFIINKDREKQLATPEKPNLYSAGLDKSVETLGFNEVQLSREVLFGTFTTKLNKLKKA